MATPLAALSDLYTHGASADALSALTSGEQQSGLDSAAEKALGFLASRGNLPLVGWGTDLTQAICHLAAYDLLSRIGYNPDDGADKNFILKNEAALKWLLQIARGEVTPPSLIFSTSVPTGQYPKVVSNPRRGW